MKQQSKFSVVHNGPIFYTSKLWEALAYARKCAARKWFMLDGVKNEVTEAGLIVYRLQGEGNIGEVQKFDI